MEDSTSIVLPQVTMFNQLLEQCQRNDPSLRHIYLGVQNRQGITLTSDQLIQLANALKQNTHVVDINLSGQDLSDEAFSGGLELLLQHHAALQELNLSNTQLDESGLEIWLSALTDHPSLRRLNLSKNNLGAEACYELLSSASGHPTLASLNLSDNPIGDEGAIQLAELLSGNCGLKTLDLKGCGLSDEGGKALLASLEHNMSLVKLNVVKSPQMSRQVRQQITDRLKAQGYDEIVEILQGRLSPRTQTIDRLQDELILQREQFESALLEQRQLFEDQLASQHQLIQEQRQLFQQLSERLDANDGKTQQIESKTNRRWEKYKPSFKETRLLSEQGFFSEVQAEQERVRLELERQERQERFYPVLMEAVKAGDLDQVQALVEEGADPTYIGTQGQACAFVEAINHLQYDVIYFLEQLVQIEEELILHEISFRKIILGTNPSWLWWDTLQQGYLDAIIIERTDIRRINRNNSGRLAVIEYEAGMGFHQEILHSNDEQRGRTGCERAPGRPRRGWAENDQIIRSCVEEYNNFIEWLEVRQAEVSSPNTVRYE